MKSAIRLFKGVEVKSHGKKKKARLVKEMLEKTIPKGFVFSPDVIANYTKDELNELVEVVAKEIGLTAEQMNNAFHKSWKKIRDASIEQLVMEQLVHYMTTYGFESMGIYDKNSVYIPNEELNIPELKEGITLTIINGYTKKELKDKLLKLLQSGIALGTESVSGAVELATYVEVSDKEVESIKNKEVKISLYDYLGLFPKNPTEFLRYAVYKATDKTLLIKNPSTIEAIKDGKNTQVLGLLTKYKKKYGLENLAQIFNRFKPLFLAFKVDKKSNQLINKISKLSKKHHKPMQEDFLNNVTSKIKNDKSLTRKNLVAELDKVNTFRKIRLAYALKFRTKDAKSIMYRIRNGKGYATDFTWDKQKQSERVLDIVLDSIANDMKKNVSGKKIYIPTNLVYALPTTEKQFTGYFPSGTYIRTPQDMICGIHWENVKGRRIDIDLSMINANRKLGWDAGHRSTDRKILFSGDLTDAPLPNGASELYYVKKQTDDVNILIANYYNYDKEINVPFKILVGQDKPKNFSTNYMIDPNNVIAVAKTELNQRQMVLGLLVTTTDECRFYFAESGAGGGITSGNSEVVQNTRKFFRDFYTDTIDLNSLLEKSGGKIVSDVEDCDIDLSPDKLDKSSIIDLIV